MDFGEEFIRRQAHHFHREFARLVAVDWCPAAVFVAKLNRVDAPVVEQSEGADGRVDADAAVVPSSLQ